MNFEGKIFLNKILVILKGLGLIFLYIILSPLILQVFLKTPLKKSFIGLNLAYLMAELIVLAILLLIFNKRIIKDFKAFKKNYKKYLKTVIPYWIIGFIIMFFSNIIINFLISNGGLAANETANRDILGKLPIYSVFAMCFLAPICEELVFRASFKKAFKNIITFSLFTGLLFAGMHVATGISSWNPSSLIANWKDLLYFIPYGSVGIAFSYAFYKTDNIFSSISLHVIHNSLTVAFLLLAFATGA